MTVSLVYDCIKCVGLTYITELSFKKDLVQNCQKTEKSDGNPN